MKSASIVLSLATAGLAAPSRPSKPTWPTRPNASTWSGWKGVKNFFVFGDSYTQTGFDVKGTQPNVANPLGNPTYPGYTSSNGPNWADFLTVTYNTSFIKTYNVAYGGATVDSALVTPYQPTVLSLKDQVQTLFVPTYGSHPAATPWTASDSLFAFFIGINDVGNTWGSANASSLYDQIFTVYSGLLEQVYQTGARNFLFLSVPPVNLAPLTLQQGNSAIQAEGKAIGTWNDKLKAMTTAFNTKHSDTTLFIHDTFGLFTQVINNPATYEQTKGLKDTKSYCTAYASGTATWYTKDASCAYAVNEYLWLNDLHPTFPIHNATAGSIAKLLS